MNFVDPTPTNLSRADISAIAENVRLKVGYTPGDSLEPIVASLGGEIHIVDEADDSGSIEIEPGRFRISIPRETSLLRDRFTIAHELGHYVLHFLYQNQRNHRNIARLRAKRYGSDQVEYEANWFAAGFLMPSTLFRQKFTEFGKNLWSVGEYFKVSPQAARVRAESLNLH